MIYRNTRLGLVIGRKEMGEPFRRNEQNSNMNKTCTQQKVFRLKLWLRFVASWAIVMVVGFVVSFYILPYGALWLAGVADQTITAYYGR
jgi:hypothetical protein